jgi:DNA-dependent protein kinase catalytic subunit
LNLKTFGIVPITNSLGSLEWIDNTEPLKVMINREHQRVEKGTDLNNCAAMNATRQWLSKIPGNTRDDHIVNQHLTMMSLKSEVLVDAFTRHKQMMKWSLLRNGLENLCLTSSAFITIKNQFVKSIAVFSIVSYLLGIGDRHLENFLVNTTDGEILGIDFGCAFGAGIQQSIPELMPFRLTQQIEGVIAPHPNDGIYK